MVLDWGFLVSISKTIRHEHHISECMSLSLPATTYFIVSKPLALGLEVMDFDRSSKAHATAADCDHCLASDCRVEEYV